MKSEQERIKKLLRDELDKDTEKIIEEVEADESLKNLALPEDMDAGLQAKIKQYEANQAVYENLSDGDKEAFRLGREQQILRVKDGSGNGAGSGTEENSDERKVVKFSKRRRMAFGLVAIVAVLVMGFGMTSFGDVPFFSSIKKQIVGNRQMVQIDSGKDASNIFGDSGIDKEEQIYQEIKDILGFDAVRLGYTPENTTFIEGGVDGDTQEAYFIYNCNSNVLEYRIFTAFRDKSLAYDIEDDCLEEYRILVSKNSINIKHYEIPDNVEDEYVAYFEHNGIHYVLNSVMAKDEFEKIIQNLENI